MADDHASSRFTRRAFSQAGIALAGLRAFAGPAAAKTEQSMPAPAMDDPRSKYPKPPFKRQSQPRPGLAREMQPPPDHGEQSYRGSGRRAGRKALITGGDSGMGRCAAIAFAREGADVVINYLPAEQPDADDVLKLIKAEGRIGVGIAGDLKDEAFCTSLVARAVQELGGLDIVVNNAARQQTRASILDVSSEDFD